MSGVEEPVPSVGVRTGIAIGGVALLLVIGLFTAPSASVPETATGPSGARYPADIRAARANLDRALLSAKSFAVGNGDSYTGFDATAASLLDPSIQWRDAVPAIAGAISIDYAHGPTVVLSTRALSGTYVCRASSRSDEAAGFEDALGATLASGCAGANP